MISRYFNDRFTLTRLLSPQEPDISNADHIRNRQQNKRHRRSIAKVREAKRGSINVETDGLSRESGTTFRQNKNLIEDAQQIHCAQEKGDQNRWFQQGQRDITKSLP